MKNKSVLTSFNLLRQGSQKLQIDSSIDVLHHLWIKQKQGGLEVPCKEFYLGIERIVRGLGAPRPNSRKGFFVTFVGLCDLFPSPVFTVRMCFDAVAKVLSEFSSKGEESDVYKGQLLAYGCLIYSGKVLEASCEEIQFLLRQVSFISSKKSYLMLAGHIFFVEWINQLEEKDFKKTMWNIVLNEILLKQKENKSLEWYNLLFVISNKFPNSVNEKFSTLLTGFPSISHEENLKLIGNLLLTASQCTAHVDVSVYNLMCLELFNNKNALTKFWLQVNKTLTCATPSMISYVFKLFVYCMQIISDKNLIRKMCVPNFVKLLSSKSNVNSLEEVRLCTITELSKIFSEKGLINSKTQETIVHNLLFYPGSFDLLHGPGMKVFQSLVNNFNEATVKSILKCFIEIVSSSSHKILAEEKNEGLIKKLWKDVEKKKACNIIVRLLNHPAVIACIDWKIEQMKIIIDMGFFPNTISAKLSEDIKQCFFSALDFKFINLTDLCIFLNGIVKYFDYKIKNNVSQISLKFSNEMRKSWEKMLKTVNTISCDGVNTDKEKEINTVFRVMFLLLGLTIFTDCNVAIENLREFHMIHEQMRSESQDLMIETRNRQELHWTDVVVDLLLSLLSYNSHFHRNIISKVFIFLCPHLSAQNIYQILAVLNPNENNVLSADNYDSDDADHSEGKLKDSTDSFDDSCSEISQESDLEEMIEEDTDYDKLRLSVREALGDAGAITDTESVDLDDLNEEEGRRLDESLSNAFRQMKNNKLKSHSAEHKQLLDFRMRVIDLIEIWLRTTPELNLVFDVMVTAIMLLENSVKNRMEFQLEAKLRSLVKHLTSVKEFTTNEKLDSKQIVELMNKLMEKCEKTASVYISMSPQVIECCTFILKVSLRKLKQMKKIQPLMLQVYKDAMHKFFQKSNCIIPVGLFKSAFMLPWEGSIHLIQDALDYCLKPDMKLFHLSHAFDFLQIFLRNKRLLTTDVCNRYISEIRQITQKFVNSVTELVGKPNKLALQFVQIYQSIKKIDVASDILDTVNINSLKKTTCNGKRNFRNYSLLDANMGKVKRVRSVSTSILDMAKDGVSQQNENGVRGTKRKVDKQKTALKLKKKRKSVRDDIHTEGIQDKVFESGLQNNFYVL